MKLLSILNEIESSKSDANELNELLQSGEYYNVGKKLLMRAVTPISGNFEGFKTRQTRTSYGTSKAAANFIDWYIQKNNINVASKKRNAVFASYSEKLLDTFFIGNTLMSNNAQIHYLFVPKKSLISVAINETNISMEFNSIYDYIDELSEDVELTDEDINKLRIASPYLYDILWARAHEIDYNELPRQIEGYKKSPDHYGRITQMINYAIYNITKEAKHYIEGLKTVTLPVRFDYEEVIINCEKYILVNRQFFNDSFSYDEQQNKYIIKSELV